MSRAGALTPAPPSSSAPELRLVAFADLGGTAWGLALSADERGVAVLASAGGTSQPPASVAVSSRGGEDGEEWEIAGADARLRIIPASPAGPEAADGTGDEEVTHERCRVLGTWSGGDELSAGGLRIRHRQVPLGELDSLREVVALFDEGAQYAVSALRPRKAKGHDRDEVRASILGEEPAQTVEDARLSTAYDAEGRVLRAGLELWLEAEDEAADEAFPHRTAAEAAVPPIRLELDSLVVEATLMRAHSRGREGVAVYTLLRPR